MKSASGIKGIKSLTMKLVLLLVVLLSINIVQSIENGQETPFEDYTEDDFRILTFDDDVVNDDFQEYTTILKTKGDNKK